VSKAAAWAALAEISVRMTRWQPVAQNLGQPVGQDP
jgi:hypothetical protein